MHPVRPTISVSEKEENGIVARYSVSIVTIVMDTVTSYFEADFVRCRFVTSSGCGVIISETPVGYFVTGLHGRLAAVKVTLSCQVVVFVVILVSPIHEIILSDGAKILQVSPTGGYRTVIFY